MLRSFEQYDSRKMHYSSNDLEHDLILDHCYRNFTIVTLTTMLEGTMRKYTQIHHNVEFTTSLFTIVGRSNVQRPLSHFIEQRDT